MKVNSTALREKKTTVGRRSDLINIPHPLLCVPLLRMSMQFSGWEVVDDGACFSGVELKQSQTPQNRGVYTMYHGTSVASARSIITSGFRPSAGGTLGQGVYVSRDINKASGYPMFSPTGKVVLKLRVRVGRVKRIDPLNAQFRLTWHSNGYDTAWLPPNSGLGGGLEEDCVFDPKRVQVVGIAKAPDNTIESELKDLISKASKSSAGPGAGGQGSNAAKACSVCKRKTQQGAPHMTQQCWKCGENICILMSKHFCPARKERG